KYERVKYAYENFGGTAAEIAENIKERMNDITDIGFTGCDAGQDSLTETFLADTLNYILWSELDGIRKMDGVDELLAPPCRKDGSKHWVCAGLRGELPSDGDKKVIEMMKSVPGFNGSKERSTADGIISRQFDFGDWRDFNGEELSMLARIRDIILNKELPSSYSSHDKMIIAKMAEGGYITVENNVPRLLVPFMNAEEYDRYIEIREDICKSKRSEVNGYLLGFIKMMNGLIPDFLDKAVRTEKAYDAAVNALTCAVAYVYSKGMIRRPDNTVNKGSYTLIWTESK
ncbi:MAG: hypothetical protein K2G89_06555, partial [Lachnospiraceae bacterium]|nr:hypothetical protein [Lachnospiraceae bacterium]